MSNDSEDLGTESHRSYEEIRIQKLEERMMDMVDVRDLHAIIKCQRCPWISRTEDEYEMRKQFADELEELIENER